ncbi:MAG: methylenetetrahydrofolate--tRNA-(uracil(54)-C(5))-methyltransferase (FADH(2)-oxidizing) TrmFO [bacterium]|nr:methylenetetrahydrofolate--tRNA-(uracil(54)-C(5))-methyltransferase (FADH(2)-oxidizing) TrmFO [bacterium]
MTTEILVIGGGLAGAEAAWQAAAGGPVTLSEMRPATMTPAHHSGDLAELVCSNSLRAEDPDTPAGLLKAEMKAMGSLVLACAERVRLPAGKALAVDREAFATLVTRAVTAHPRIRLVREEVRELPEEGVTVVATGPLTSPSLAGSLAGFAGEAHLYFYDAASPIVTGESIDRERTFRGSRYGRGGEEDYLNCPLDQDEYEVFWRALVGAEQYPRKEFEETVFFEGCLPVEEQARRGRDTLRFGPLRPVGLRDPVTGREPYAVVQLRQDNLAATLYGLVGFQTNLRSGEQERVFRLIPALREARLVRYGVMHRNTYLNSPRLLKPSLEARKRPGLFFAGQLTGVEGYLESAATGMVAGINARRRAAGTDPLILPGQTMAGSLCHYVAGADPSRFQPMNANFGLLPTLAGHSRQRRRERMVTRSLEALGEYLLSRNFQPPSPCLPS